MGGGDLNLKKSWHPSTFQNLEKVWKAEQRDEQEKKKIEQLQQEIREERAREDMHKVAVESGLIKARDERVEWLYSGPAGGVNREEYLLGRKIDRLVDPVLAEEEKEKEAMSSGPGALFVGADSANTSTDLAVKIREDPLFVIRQREEAAKKRLASNPMKLRQLKQKVTGEKKEKRKHEKKKRKHRSAEEGSSSMLPVKKIRKSDRSRSRSPPTRTRSPPSRTRSPPTRTRSPPTRTRSPPTRTRSPPTMRSPPRQSKWSSRYRPYSKPSSRTRGMDANELERRRREMMDSAREHDKEREKRLRRHEAEADAEEHTAKTQQKKDFLQPLRVDALSSSSSLSDRIHRNIHSVQRTSAKLDSNFMSK